MAHIASCMSDADVDRLSIGSYIARSVSPLPVVDEVEQQASKPWVWRMMSQSETRKYQLFPREKQAAGPQGKRLDPEQAFALAMAQNGDKGDKPCTGGLRLRIKEHNLIRRRKVSVPELGPMTTVHEAAMDSPTIPGRPACHERSISAPGNGWKMHHLAYRNETHLSPLGDSGSDISTTTIPQPQSPKNLPPLVIPVQTYSLPKLTRQLSLSRLRSGSTGSAESSIRPTRTEESPRTRSPYTPHSASLTASTPMSSAPSSTFSNSSLPTPVSGNTEPRASPKPWKGEANQAGLETPKDQGNEFGQNMATPRSAVETRSASSFSSHRRNVSESGSVTASIMDRGRPRKRNDGLKRSASKTSKSAERRAFETLPKGWKVTDAAQMLEQAERVALHKQAMQQAARFEVMRKEDVDSLSRELRNLDERTEYLRRTYHSLRAGRRNLHSRICQYLRSPRMAKFSHDSMLKQEEALAELDSSIDDWVNKLEQAENRRTRIRQKLLEHVAAAVTLPVSGAVGVSESLQLALGVGAAPPTAPANLSTPPRSPVKSSFTTPRIESSSPSPQRVVAQVPSTIIEQPVVENAATVGLGINQTGEKQPQAKEKETIQHPLSGMRRADVESIRIYAGDEVAALLADVESQMDRMSRAADDAAALRMKDTCVPDLPELNANMSEEERKQVHR
ncbi:hypothetical protein FJTKL_04424 [Diaporthe vaccinii]|uniref:Up-regulated during septation protein 1 domain-containing protein n=2 Tax=Diaporthe vaccinii TaxID=105482 RepID=A0ABR4DT74_9PEZI